MFLTHEKFGCEFASKIATDEGINEEMDLEL